jgi:hypothetical protein
VADSKRLKTLKRLTDYLATEIKVSRGYKHDLDATRVIRGRFLIDDDDPIPMVSILDNINPDREPLIAGAESNRPQALENWILLLQGWTNDDKDFPCDNAYELMADVKKALARIGHPRTQYQEPLVYYLGGLIRNRAVRSSGFA